MLNRLQGMSSVFTPFRSLLSRWLLSLIVVFVAASTFLELAEDVWLNEGFTWDATVMLDIHTLSRPWLDKLFWLIGSGRFYLRKIKVNSSKSKFIQLVNQKYPKD